MKIVLLGLIVLALTDGIVAAPRDNDNHLVKKLEAESETIPAQLQQLQAQLNDQQQQIKEQQHQIKEQQHRMEVQQQRNEEQQRQMKAFMQINRARQSDTVTGVSQCAVGTYSTTRGENNAFRNGFYMRTPISYGRTFSRVPTVVTSIAGFERGKIATGLVDVEGYNERQNEDEYNMKTYAEDATKDNFYLYLEVEYVQIWRLDVTWIACA